MARAAIGSRCRRGATAWMLGSTASRRSPGAKRCAAGQLTQADVVLSAVAALGVGRRHRAARRGSGAGSADSALGRRRQAGGRHRRLQRQPAEGADPDRPVLLDQPAQLGDQHPRAGRAVRAHQRWSRAGRRPLHRRRVLRTAGLGDARLPRRRTDRGAARAAGDAVRQEHHRRRDQRHDQETELHAGERGRAQRRRSRVRAGQGLGHRRTRRARWRAGSRSLARSAAGRSRTSRRGRP